MRVLIKNTDVLENWESTRVQLNVFDEEVAGVEAARYRVVGVCQCLVRRYQTAALSEPCVILVFSLQALLQFFARSWQAFTFFVALLIIVERLIPLLVLARWHRRLWAEVELLCWLLSVAGPLFVLRVFPGIVVAGVLARRLGAEDWLLVWRHQVVRSRTRPRGVAKRLMRCLCARNGVATPFFAASLTPALMRHFRWEHIGLKTLVVPFLVVCLRLLWRVGRKRVPVLPVLLLVPWLADFGVVRAAALLIAH